MRVALDTARFSLIQGDTLEVLRTFADKSVDCIITDPPYAPHVHEKLGKERRNDGVEIRAELDFPPMTKALMRKVAREYVRICRGWIISFSDFYNSAWWGTYVQGAGGSWVRTGQWVKTNPMPQMTGDRPGTGSEDIVVAHAKMKGFEWNAHGKAATWRGRRDAGYGDEPHPNQKPAWLLQKLIGMFCPPNAVILDPYFGSGTTAIGAFAPERLEGESTLETTCPKCAKKILEQYQAPMPQNVSVIGIEGAQKYIDLSISRIREAAPALLAA
jgi:site-specific DNA-methyltransferase (adenine-specific)